MRKSEGNTFDNAAVPLDTCDGDTGKSNAFDQPEYAGSLPKSQPLAFQLLEISKETATTTDEKYTARFYLAYLKRLEAVQTKQAQMFAESSRELVDLAKAGLAVAEFANGKELVKLTGLMKQEEKKKQMQVQGSAWIADSARQAHVPAFFYMGWIHENGPPDIRDTEVAYEWYLLSAAYGNPQAYFKLAQM